MKMRGPRKGEDLISRAALYRIEAEALRERACAVHDTLIRDQYLDIAARWSLVAAHLEIEAVAKTYTTLL